VGHRTFCGTEVEVLPSTLAAVDLHCYTEFSVSVHVEGN